MRPMGGSRKWHGGYHNSSARDGHFEVHGLAPDASVAVHFLERRRKLGATGAANQGPIVRRLLREFTVKPGESLDLGDIVIEKPRP
jgi:hypothetical protein